jgi:hypothetical protein
MNQPVHRLLQLKILQGLGVPIPKFAGICRDL